MLLLALIFASLFSTITPLNNGLLSTPPMGWLDWERYRCNTDCENDPYNCIGEVLIKTTADAMASEGYLDAGYKYITIDDCWIERDRDPVTHRLVPDRKRFPSGIKALADYVHSKGLLFGIYEDVGTSTCAGYPGSEFYMQIDTQTFAEWGVDYVKLDGCYFDPSYSQEGYSAFGHYLNLTGKPIVYSCEWPLYLRAAGKPVDYKAVSQVCNLWRTGYDIDDGWWSVSSDIDFYASNQDGFIQVAGPGAWNDPDMLVVGDYGLSEQQERSQFAFYCMWAAALIISVDIRPGAGMRPFSKALLQNKNLIRIHQDPLGKPATQILSRDTFRVWKRQLSTPGAFAIIIYNRVTAECCTSGYPLRASFALDKDFGLTNASGYNVYEAFTNTLLGLYSLNNNFSCMIPSYDVCFIVLVPTQSGSPTN